MSKTTPHLFRRIVLIGLCVTLMMTAYTLILAPGVGAASDATKTETKIEDYDNTVSNEDALLTKRANTIDEAKKEAQEVVSEQRALLEAKAATEAPTEAPAAPATQSQPASTASSESHESPAPAASSNESSYASSNTSDDESYDEENTISASGSGDYLLDIDNPDYNYVGYSVSLSDEDRDMAERILMGEAGGEGYIGMALVAQCIRDTYVNGSYSSIAQLLKQNGYYGSTSIAPSETAKEVVNFIFDQGGSAVQHNIRIFYATNMCSSSWHEAQEFVVQYNYVRFFNY
ncbi:hypothetical protein [Ruminococcus sp.]|uniref:hypothetical protein n=1 Tax=Ruminococcus sp. TaxID=41978 RepID=UPI0038901B06